MKGWLLDTNVVGELSKPRPYLAVGAWFGTQRKSSIFVSILTIGETLQGIHNLQPDAPERTHFAAKLADVEASFDGRILPIADAIVRRWGEVSGAALRTTGRVLPAIDALLACTAIEHRLYLVTRNVRDVRATGAAVFNPWTDDPGRFPLSA